MCLGLQLGAAKRWWHLQKVEPGGRDHWRCALDGNIGTLTLSCFLSQGEGLSLSQAPALVCWPKVTMLTSQELEGLKL